MQKGTGICAESGRRAGETVGSAARPEKEGGVLGSGGASGQIAEIQFTDLCTFLGASRGTIHQEQLTADTLTAKIVLKLVRFLTKNGRL